MTKHIILVYALLYLNQLCAQQQCKCNLPDSMSVMTYLEKYGPVAVGEMKQAYLKGLSILASVSLAQGLLESNAGKSSVALRSLNHFCIKWLPRLKGTFKYIEYPDDDYVMRGGRWVRLSKFIKFETAEDAYRYRSVFLGQKRYAEAIKLGIGYQESAQKIAVAGWASAPTYSNCLIFLIEKYKLYQYDKPLSPVAQKGLRILPPKFEESLPPDYPDQETLFR